MRWKRVVCLACVCVTGGVHAAAFAPEAPGVARISLAGEWKFQQDKTVKTGRAAANGWEKPDFDDAAWKTLRAPGAWEVQGYPGYNGIGWYRQRVFIPSEWKGSPLWLRLGMPDDGGETYFNGKSLGLTAKFGTIITHRLPPELVKWDAENVIAVRIWDWYQNGGLAGVPDDFELLRVQPFVPSRDVRQFTPVALDVADEKLWLPGWRDEGTSDTRPKLRVVPAAYQGAPALEFDVWYPNSMEFMDCQLKREQNGAVWKANQAEYIAFKVKSTTAGEMRIRLSKSPVKWRNGVTPYGTRFYVKAGDWEQVMIPLNAFVTDKGEALSDLSAMNILSLGYGNHELQAPGKVMFADVKVGSFNSAPAARPIALSGLWRFALDNMRPDGTKSDLKENLTDKQGYGEQLGWHKPGFDDSKWDAIRVGATWESQGYNYDGPAWYRQQVMIPQAWKGRPLVLRVGRPDDRGELFWNGQLVQKIEKFGPEFEVTLQPDSIRYGQMNTLAVRVHDWYVAGGLAGAAFSIGPETASVEFVPAKMGALPNEQVQVRIQLMKELASEPGLKVSYRITDCFFHSIADGLLPLQAAANGDWQGTISLTPEQSRKLYYGEWIDVRGVVVRADGSPLMSFAQLDLRLDYTARDAYLLPPLPEKVEPTPLGDLKLVDVITATDREHPYKEGGVRAFWGGRRAYSPWLDGVRLQTFKDRQYREATHNQHFGYRIGRGKLKPGSVYLLRILYPEDKRRYFAMDVKAGRNYQGIGFRNGVSADNPITPYPLTGNYEWCDVIVPLDDLTYGYQGRRTVSAENGFWVFFHDIGRVYSPQYDAGPAIAEMRLYEITNPQASYVNIRYPEQAPRRVLMMDWERQPEANPADMAQYARLMGLTAVSPVMLKWGNTAFYHNTQEYKPAPEWYGLRVSKGDDHDYDVYRRFLEAGKKYGVSIIPRVEYGGSANLPKEARVIGPNGKQDPCGRFTQWGANLLHPATWQEVETMIKDLVGTQIKEFPNIGGILWRMRSDRVKCSYGAQDVEMFCKETGREMPKGDAAAVAKWASSTVEKDYHTWWHGKRAAFHKRMVDLLRSYRPDLRLYYYNWDPDGWSLADGAGNNTKEDWSDQYNVDRARLYYDRKIAAQKKLTDTDYLQRFTEGRAPHTNDQHKRFRPEFYKDMKGMAFFAPVHWHYLSDNEPYINYFRTGDGLAICNQYYYEEKGRTNVQGDNYETSEMDPGGPDFAMAEEVLSFFHGDPNVITWTPYTIGRCFATEHRRFAQAFLALPDVPGTVVPQASADLKVRTYQTPKALYVSVAHKGWKAAKFNIVLPGVTGKQVTDLVTGETIPARQTEKGLEFDVTPRAMELLAFRIDR